MLRSVNRVRSVNRIRSDIMLRSLDWLSTGKIFPTISGPVFFSLLSVDDLAGFKGVESFFLPFSLASLLWTLSLLSFFANPVTETKVRPTRLLSLQFLLFLLFLVEGWQIKWQESWGVGSLHSSGHRGQCPYPCHNNVYSGYEYQEPQAPHFLTDEAMVCDDTHNMQTIWKLFVFCNNQKVSYTCANFSIHICTAQRPNKKDVVMSHCLHGRKYHVPSSLNLAQAKVSILSQE